MGAVEFKSRTKVLPSVAVPISLKIKPHTAPGGSGTGQPGRNAAIAILQDDGKSLEQVVGKPPRGP
jgi:hypothetical protein